MKSTRMIWSDALDQFLQQHYRDHGPAWCAERMGVKYNSVAFRASFLGLTRHSAKPLDHPHIPGFFWTALCGNAATRGWVVEITPDDIWAQYQAQQGRCALTGWAVVFGRKGVMTASVDRIDSSLGYTRANIQVVHKRVNRSKLALSDEQFREMCASIAAYRPDLVPHTEEWRTNDWHDTEQPFHRGRIKDLDVSEEALFPA